MVIKVDVLNSRVLGNKLSFFFLNCSMYDFFSFIIEHHSSNTPPPPPLLKGIDLTKNPKKGRDEKIAEV